MTGTGCAQMGQTGTLPPTILRQGRCSLRCSKQNVREQCSQLNGRKSTRVSRSIKPRSVNLPTWRHSSNAQRVSRAGNSIADRKRCAAPQPALSAPCLRKRDQRQHSSCVARWGAPWVVHGCAACSCLTCDTAFLLQLASQVLCSFTLLRDFRTVSVQISVELESFLPLMTIGF